VRLILIFICELVHIYFDQRCELHLDNYRLRNVKGLLPNTLLNRNPLMNFVLTDASHQQITILRCLLMAAQVKMWVCSGSSDKPFCVNFVICELENTRTISFLRSVAAKVPTNRKNEQISIGKLQYTLVTAFQMPFIS